MPGSPWKSFGQVAPDREYLVLLSFLPLKRFRTIPWFQVQTLRIMKQLSGTKGLVGYSLLARPLAKRFWTLSVWESEAALLAFVRAEPHGRTMHALAPHMGPTKFVRWRLEGSALPPRWDDALRRWAEP